MSEASDASNDILDSLQSFAEKKTKLIINQKVITKQKEATVLPLSYYF
jgi:hypothetical protein